jgi:hypothetical protein
MSSTGGEVVYHTLSEGQAELIAGALRSTGIGATVLAGRFGSHSATGEFSVLVHADVAQDAREFITALEESET